MKIKLKTLYASPVKVYQIDEVGDFSTSEGQALIDGKYGISLEPIEADEIKPVIMAAIHPAETVINQAENLIIKQKLVKKVKKSKKGKK